MTRDGERKKEMTEALDAVAAEFAWHDSTTGQELLNDVVQRLLSADEVQHEAAAKWLRGR